MRKERRLDPSQLTVHIGYWMRLVSNHVSHSFARRLIDSGATVAEWVILREMYGGDDSTSPSTIAEITGLTRGAVSKLISRLLEKELVVRTESIDDRRYQDLRLTAKGAALVPRLAAIADENDEEFFACLTKSERSQLKLLLKKIADHHELKKQPLE